MARKKKKKNQKQTPPAQKQDSFSNPFATLKLTAKAKPKEQEAKKVTPTPEPSLEHIDTSSAPPGIDPLEAAFFLNSMGQVHKVKHDKPKVPGPTPLEVAQLEENLAMAELESLIGNSQSWTIDIDEDKIYTARAPGVSKQMTTSLQKGEIPPNKSIDLHGMTRQEAHQEVRRTLLSVRRDNHRCLKVVTGRGQNTPDGHGVLKEALPTWVTTAPLNAHVLALVTAPGRLGGHGAYLILIRRPVKK
jgi:DNA-nicking Smr family endonuclease